MASRIARTSEYAAVTVTVLLGLSCLVSACSSSPRQDVTGSISSQSAQNNYAASLPPVIHAPATMPAAQPVAYAPVYAPRQISQGSYRQATQACTCASPPRYEVTASIPQSRPAPTAAGKRQFVVHTIARNETLYSIARLYHTKVSDIATVNRMNGNARLRYGELLVVPTTVR